MCRRVPPPWEDGNVVLDQIEKIVSGKDALSHTGTSPRIPSRFRATSRSLSGRLVFSKH